MRVYGIIYMLYRREEKYVKRKAKKRNER